jgi:hypothetical protein
VLTIEDVNAVVAQWEEWTADAGFSLSIEVKDGGAAAEMVESTGGVAARLQSSPYVQIQVRGEPPVFSERSQSSPYVEIQIRGGAHLVFSQRIPHDGAMLRASVTTLARYIASLRESDDDRLRDDG